MLPTLPTPRGKPLDRSHDRHVTYSAKSNITSWHKCLWWIWKKVSFENENRLFKFVGNAIVSGLENAQHQTHISSAHRRRLMRKWVEFKFNTKLLTFTSGKTVTSQGKSGFLWRLLLCTECTKHANRSHPAFHRLKCFTVIAYTTMCGYSLHMLCSIFPFSSNLIMKHRKTWMRIPLCMHPICHRHSTEQRTVPCLCPC